MRRLPLLLPLLLALVAPHGAPQAQQTAPQTQQGAGLSPPARGVAALPAELSAFRRASGVTDYERVQGGTGLGASVRYAPKSGERIFATVYLYDRGRPRQPDGAGSPDVRDELRRAAAELQAVVGAGHYRSAQFETGMDIGSAPAADSISCANFRLVHGDGTPSGDSVCVTVQGGLFVKVRVTNFATPEPTAAGLMAAGLTAEVLAARRGKS